MRRSPVRRLRTLLDASWTRRAQARDDEAGFTLVELVVALMLITIVATGLMVSVGLGFRTVAIARQRQTAAALASQNLEQLRNLTYDKLYLNNDLASPADQDSAPANSTDPTNPDFFVSTNGLQYDVTGAPLNEDLVIGVAGDTDGASHLVDPYQVGPTQMRVFIYVTWVTDPSAGGAHAYKRGTVVVQYHAPAANGVNQIVRASAFFTKDTLTFNPPATNPTNPTTSTTAGSPTTTTTVPGTTTTTTVPAACPGDTTAPTGGFTIGVPSSALAGYTNTPNVTLNLNSLSDPCSPIITNFSNDNVSFASDVVYDPLNAQLSWALTGGDGLKTVYGNVKDGAANSAAFPLQHVVLDTTKPTKPASISRTVVCNGSTQTGTRTVTLAWTVSVDTNFVGYRVYRSTDGTTWQQLAITTSLGISDTLNRKSGNSSTRYYVVGYDKAGNESNASNIISLANNTCK